MTVEILEFKLLLTSLYNLRLHLLQDWEVIMGEIGLPEYKFIQGYIKILFYY